ncbi:MAG: DUF115 domain-containing protein [Magnetococcales bacterium]|nr:DUF115 domain-containing protein [Magnetococcales bacterium]
MTEAVDLPVDSIDYGPFLVNTFGERYLPTVNGETFSSSGSDTFYHQHFNDTVLDKDSLYIIAGSDAGLLIRYILRKGVPDGTRYLFLELPGLVERIRSDFFEQQQEIPPSIQLCTINDWQQQALSAGISDYLYLGNVKPVKSMAVVDAAIRDYLPLWNQLVNHLYELRMAVTMEVGNHAFLVSGMKNVASNRTPVTVLKDVFTGYTAALLAGGPSLSEALPWVQQHRHQLLVIAVARITEQLQQAGIVPDIIAAIDPHEVSFQASNAMLTLPPETLFLNMYHVHPKLLGQWHGRHVYLGQVLPWESPINRPNYSFPGITVSHQALGVAFEMGCSQVILCGFDLCFSREGLTHVKGSVESRMGPFMDQTDYHVETNGGWMADTRIDFHIALGNLRDLAAMAPRYGCQLINPAAAAAKVDGVTHQPWSDIVLSPLPEPVHDRLHRALPIDNREQRLAHYQAVMTELNQARQQVQAIHRLTVEALDCNARFFGRKGKPADFRFKLRMDEIEQILDSQHKVFSMLVKRWSLIDFLKLVRVDKEREWSDEEVEKAGDHYYRVYRNNANAVLNWLDTTREHLRCCIEEEQERPNFKKIIAEWRRNQQPGRYRLLLDRHGWRLDDLPPTVASQFRELEQQFQEQLHPPDNPYRKHIERLSHPLTVRSKMQQLFQQRDVERLRTLAEGLRQSELEGREVYLDMIDGYLAELAGEDEAALAAFGRVTLPVFREQALAHLTTIHLRRQEYLPALEQLRQLAAFSPTRMPHYASLLRIIGRRDEAIATYRRYLEMANDDLVVLLRLAQLESECGHPHEARTLYERILARDPGNNAARQLLDALNG